MPAAYPLGKNNKAFFEVFRNKRFLYFDLFFQTFLVELQNSIQTVRNDGRNWKSFIANITRPDVIKLSFYASFLSEFMMRRVKSRLLSFLTAYPYGGESNLGIAKSWNIFGFLLVCDRDWVPDKLL